ncbi:MAG: trimethylamine methyltransferase family protein [Deltaproteobacteria bacterium]
MSLCQIRSKVMMGAGISRTGIDTVSGFGLKIFSEDQVRAVHYATLEVLQDVGIRVESEEALEIFHDSGASIEKAKGYGIVRFPPHLVEDCIRSAPFPVTWYGRDPANDFKAELRRVGFSTFGECIQLTDPYTLELRPATKKDLADATRVCDSLDEMAVVERALGSLDQYSESQSLHNFEAMATNTSKHIFLGFNDRESAKRIIEMAGACVGGMENLRRKPILTAFVCPTSPLELVRKCTDVIIECARSGIGVSPISMVLLPCWVGGGHSDSKLPDAQAAYESGLTATVSALAGANIIYGAGCFESGLSFDYAKLIMDCEEIRMIRHTIKGINVTDYEMAVNVIKEVGPGGEYLTHQHTYENMKNMSRSDLFDRRRRDSWMEKTGGKTLTERAYDEARRILESHRPLPLPGGAAETMRAIIEEYESERTASRQ